MCNVFIASEPLAGRRLTKVTERRTKADWALFVQDIATSYPEAERITLVMDNLNTHTPGSLYEAFAPEQAKALLADKGYDADTFLDWLKGRAIKSVILPKAIHKM